MKRLFKISAQSMDSGEFIKFKKTTFYSAIIGFFCFVISFYYFFPGFMSVDSLNQYIQAVNNQYGDWHPPIMSWVWRVLLKFSAGPSGLLFFQLTAFWSALSIFAALLFRKPLHIALLICGIGFFPPIFTHIGIIWKDVEMAIGFALSIGFLFLAILKQNKLCLWTSLIPLFYGFSVRHNAPPSSIPILIFIGGVFTKLYFPQNSRKKNLKNIATLGVAAVIFIGFKTINNLHQKFTRVNHNYPVQQIWAYDFIGVSSQLKTVILPDFINKKYGPYQQSDIFKMYSPFSIVEIYNGSPKRMPYIYDKNEIDTYCKDWIKMVTTHPKEYLLHRLRLWTTMLELDRQFCGAPFIAGILPNDKNIVYEQTKVRTWIKKTYDLSTSFGVKRILYGGWFYLTLNIFLLAFSIVFLKKNGWVPLLLVSCGLLYELPYLFVTTACDFRMHWWTALVNMICIALLFSKQTRDLDPWKT